MMDKGLRLENSFEVEVEEDAVVHVQLGWDMKRGGLKEKIEGQVAAAVIGISEKEYDLNLAAIVEHDTQEAELVFHHGPGGHGADESGAVLLSKDDRSGFGGGSDEDLRVRLKELPESVRRIVFFMNIGGANVLDQHLTDVDNVFVQIQNDKNCKVYLREEEAFRAERAQEYCCYTFAELCRKGKAGCCAVSPVIPERTASWKRCGRFAIAEWDPNREKAEAADQPSVASAFSIDSGRFKAETLSSA